MTAQADCHRLIARAVFYVTDCRGNVFCFALCAELPEDFGKILLHFLATGEADGVFLRRRYAFEMRRFMDAAQSMAQPARKSNLLWFFWILPSSSLAVSARLWYDKRGVCFNLETLFISLI